MTATTHAMLALALLPALATTCGAMCPEAAGIGRPAPDFALPDLDGEIHRLSDLKGHIVILEWTNHECPAVNGVYDRESVEQAAGTFAHEPVTWLLVDSSHFCGERAGDIRRWCTRRRIVRPYLLDPTGRVGRLYDARRTPQVFVIDAEGVLAYSGAMTDRDGRTNYVTGAVKALLNGVPVTPTTVRPWGCSVKYGTDGGKSQ